MFALLDARDSRWRWQDERQRAERHTFRRLELGLSEKEWEVLLLLADESLTVEQIAARLHRSPSTVKTHISRIGNKLGVDGRKEVVAVVRERGLLPNGDARTRTPDHMHSSSGSGEIHDG